MTPYLKYDSVSDTESFIMTPYSKYSPLKNIHPWKIFTPEQYSPLKNIHPWKIFNIKYFFEGRIRSHNEWLRIRYGWIFDTESSNCAISPLCTGPIYQASTVVEQLQGNLSKDYHYYFTIFIWSLFCQTHHPVIRNGFRWMSVTFGLKDNKYKFL